MTQVPSWSVPNPVWYRKSIGSRPISTTVPGHYVSASDTTAMFATSDDIVTASCDTTPVSISTRFHPSELDMQDTDLMLLATDNVFFCAHQSILVRESVNRFGGLVENESSMELVDLTEPSTSLDPCVAPSVVMVPYSADVLNVLLHLVYGLSVERYQPSAHTLRAVFPALHALGYDIHAFAAPRSELFTLIVQASAADPLPMYALAAQYAVEPLAVAISPLTLSGSLCGINDELSQQMGPLYLKRLFFLHLGRTDALKRLVLPPPETHPPVPGAECSPDAIARAWTLACAHVVVDGRIDTLAALSAHLRCSRCRKNMDERVDMVVRGWDAIKSTI